MEFTLPTTKTEMLDTLKLIYEHYRINKGEFLQKTLSPLSLENLTFQKKTDGELKEIAKIYTSAEQKKEKAEYIAELKQKIKSLETKKESLTASLETATEKAEETYRESEKKIELNVVQNGLYSSSIVADKMTELEKEKNETILELNSDYNKEVATIEGEISGYNLLIENADEYFQEIFDSEIEKKAEELKEEQEKLEREVFRYNNGLEEKRQKYANQILESNMSYELKYMEIDTLTLSKEQLVNMGYYRDVINCVCAYYDLMDSATALEEILAESSLVFYLDDFYQNIVYMYKMKE